MPVAEHKDGIQDSFDATLEAEEASSLLATTPWAKSDLGLILENKSISVRICVFSVVSVSFWDYVLVWRTYFPTCLLRRAFSFAVHGDMMLSEGEIYCFVLEN